MFDDLHSPHGGLDGPKRQHRFGDRPLADREVPIDRGGLPLQMHSWLDGHLPEAAVRQGETRRDVEFWKLIQTETERYRHMRTPAHVTAAIMEALRAHAPQVITPWYRREFVMTPASALVSSTVLVSVAATAAVLMARALG
jgi:hypothetical protein